MNVELFKMDVNVILLIIAVASLAIVFTRAFYAWLTKKGVNAVNNAVTTMHVAEGVLNGAETVTDILKTVFPSNAIVNVADKIIDYAKTGVAKAEQLYFINQITGAERNAEAKRFICDTLECAGIERNETIDKIIDGAVEAAVLMLGHTEKTPEDCGGRGVESF
jgi:hypothetical protein